MVSGNSIQGNTSAKMEATCQRPSFKQNKNAHWRKLSTTLGLSAPFLVGITSIGLFGVAFSFTRELATQQPMSQ
jgi:hypothetical protein